MQNLGTGSVRLSVALESETDVGTVCPSILISSPTHVPVTKIKTAFHDNEMMKYGIRIDFCL